MEPEEMATHITTLIGDATDPYPASEPAIIAHIVNNVGAWGSGFVVPLGQSYPKSKVAYLGWSRDLADVGLVDVETPVDFRLGETQFVPVNTRLEVANMCAQDGLPTHEKREVVDYRAVSKCFSQVLDRAITGDAAIHMPRIGCGRGGGTWPEILEALADGVNTSMYCNDNRLPAIYVYDLPPADPGKGEKES